MSTAPEENRARGGENSPEIDARILREFVVEILREVGPAIRENFGHTGELSYKYGHEAITRVDGEVEAALIERIRSRFGDHRIVGEETGESGPEGSGWTWTIDPVDGTLNYALGVPLFSSTVAVLHHGVIVAGGVYEPLSARCFHAGRGEGAWLDDQPLRVSARDRAGEAIASTQSSRRGRFVSDANIHHRVRQSFMKTRRLGSIALELAYVAAGRFDALLASKRQAQNLYDVAAGLLLVEEAGGKVSNGRGENFRDGDNELVASNGRLHAEILDMVRP